MAGPADLVMDRGMAGRDKRGFLREGGRRYIVGTAKNSLRKFERELLSEDWGWCMQGWKCGSQRPPGGQEVFILCRSAERRAKEQAMHERFEKRIEEARKDSDQLPEEETEAVIDRHTRGPVAGRKRAERLVRM